jgi:S1-C subfamily serine protease
VTAAGDLVGINTAVLSHEQGIEGIGFAIPVNLVRSVAAEVEAKGRVMRGWSGVGVRGIEFTDERSQPARGVQVIGFYAHSPGPAAGIAAGDVITAIDGAPVTSVQDFLGTISRKPPGARVRLSLIRPGQGRFAAELPVVAQPLER